MCPCMGPEVLLWDEMSGCTSLSGGENIYPVRLASAGLARALRTHAIPTPTTGSDSSAVIGQRERGLARLRLISEVVRLVVRVNSLAGLTLSNALVEASDNGLSQVPPDHVDHAVAVEAGDHLSSLLFCSPSRDELTSFPDSITSAVNEIELFRVSGHDGPHLSEFLVEIPKDLQDVREVHGSVLSVRFERGMP